MRVVEISVILKNAEIIVVASGDLDGSLRATIGLRGLLDQVEVFDRGEPATLQKLAEYLAESPDAVIFVAAEPSDTLTHAILQSTGLPANR